MPKGEIEILLNTTDFVAVYKEIVCYIKKIVC